MNALSLFEQPKPVGQFPTPRPFQDVAHNALRQGLADGHMNQLLVAPTGSGKTVVGLRVIHEALKRGKRALFVCDRIALINQTSARADEYGMTNHAVVQAGHWRRDNSQPFQICSIQTIQRRGFWPDADVIVLDEAHTLNSAAIEKLERKSVPIIGLTATPCTKGLGLYYTNMVNAATMHELTESGVLVPMRIMTCVTPDMAGAETSGGEWTAKVAAEREAKIIGDVVGEWIAHAENRKTIAFGADIAYCTQLVQRFNEAGINAATFTSETPDGERAELLKEFSKPDSIIRILVSVEALAKGFDVPDIGCVIDARPLRKSLSTAIQMWGRGLRSSPGKQECLLLDFTGNIRRFMADFEDVYFNGFKSLSTAEKQDSTVRNDEEYTPAGCPQCGHKPFHRHCLSCGFEKVSRALEDTTQGVMKEIRIGKSKKVAAESGQDLWAQLCTYARQNLKSDKKSGWAWHKFREITGQDLPRGFPHFDSTPDVQVSGALASHLHYAKIKYWKGQAKVKSQGVAA